MKQDFAAGFAATKSTLIAAAPNFYPEYIKTQTAFIRRLSELSGASEGDIYALIYNNSACVDITTAQQNTLYGIIYKHCGGFSELKKTLAALPEDLPRPILSVVQPA